MGRGYCANKHRWICLFLAQQYLVDLPAHIDLTVWNTHGSVLSWRNWTMLFIRFLNNCYWLTFQFQNLSLKNTLQQHFMKLDCNELLTTVFTNCIFTTVFQEYFLMSCSSACHPCWPWPLSRLHWLTMFWNCILLGWPFCVFALILLSFLYVLWWNYCVYCTTFRVYIFSCLIPIFLFLNSVLHI